MSDKCESCKRGYDGRNGNGYSPCGCQKRIIVIGCKSKTNKLIRALSVLMSRPPNKP